ncbi:AmmeMemoRadiSam system protein B [Candidatus Calescamantes bacterium]|nr:AmmeMemoRadiSam system protein B [Candidatus Calescamantes bacterium]
MFRKARFDGEFYPSDAFTLRDFIKGLLPENPSREKVKGIIVPHSGYFLSGKVYAEVYSRIEIPHRVILLGPNHKGEGSLVSIWDKGEWETPLGRVRINEDMADALISYSRFLEVDTRSHEEEHSLEVQLPFLQYINPEVEIVPVLFLPSDYEVYMDIVNAIKNTGEEWGEDILILATTDFTYSHTQEEIVRLDRLTMEAIENLDDLTLLERIENHKVNMCGYVPVIVNILACKELGARKGEILLYSTSGEVTGYYDEIRGYGGIIIK